MGKIIDLRVKRDKEEALYAALLLFFEKIVAHFEGKVMSCSTFELSRGKVFA